MKTRKQRLDAGLEVLGRGGSAVDVARSAAVDARLARALVAARPGDARAVLERLLDVEVTLRTHEQQLRTALTWPGVTLVTVGLSALVLTTVAGPALRHLPVGQSLSAGVLALPTVLAALAFAVLVAATTQRWSFVGVTAWRALECWSFSAVTGALVRATASLPVASRAAAELCSGARRGAALGLAHELEAGSLSAACAAPLLGDLGARLLVVTAPTGAALATLDALVSLGDASLEREVRRDARRLSAWGLGLGAAAFFATAVIFFQAYLHGAEV